MFPSLLSIPALTLERLNPAMLMDHVRMFTATATAQEALPIPEIQEVLPPMLHLCGETLFRHAEAVMEEDYPPAGRRMTMDHPRQTVILPTPA